eukprot:Rmarinus@m.25597
MESQEEWKRLSSSGEKGCEIIFHELHFRIGDNVTYKELLTDVTAMIRPNEMCAIMGPSGAGKSTLLNLLAGRIDGASQMGSLFYGGLPAQNYERPPCAYVMQDDVHLATLTVRETLLFAAKLRLRGTDEERERRVETLLDVLKIRHCEDTPVGSVDSKGISGGERKRLSIGVEIVSLPDLLFMDEPTTGLDSEMALEVMQSIREVTNRHRTTLCTIHQPSAKIFGFFDKLLLLGKGRMLYFGSPDDAIRMLTSPELGFSREKFTNPADFVLNAASSDFEKLRAIEGTYRKSSLFRSTAAEVEKCVHDASSKGAWRYVIAAPPKPEGRFWTMLLRFATVLRREKITVLLVIKTMFMAFLFGSLFYQPPQDINGAQSRYSVLFYSVFFNSITNLHAIAEISLYRRLFERERASGVYTTFHFHFSFLIVEVPLLVLCALVYTTMITLLVDLNGSFGSLFYFFFVVLMLQFSSMTLCQMMASFTTNLHVAFTYIPFVIMLLSCFAGFFIRASEIPRSLSWLAALSYTRWGLSGMVVNEFDGTGEWCFDDVPLCVDDSVVIEYFDADGWDKWNTVAVISGWLVFYQILTVLFLSRVTMERSSIYRLTSPVKETELDQSAGLGTCQGDEEKTRELAAPLLQNRRDAELEVDEGVGWNREGSQTGGGLNLIFRGVRYAVFDRIHNKQKEILFGVDGFVSSCEMCALMGPSGAGKTSLLDLLAGRRALSTVMDSSEDTDGGGAGIILYNGIPLHAMSARHEALLNTQRAYVLQDDVHIPELTVRETLEYAAKFRLRGKTVTEINARVFSLLALLRLDGAQHTRVSDISGGERKRLSIAVEIVAVPHLIFLDEPTSGLDSEMALEVMQSVRDLTNRHRTTICTIHQPSAAIFNLFDKLLLLGEGRVLYFGEASALADFLTTPPLSLSMKDFDNPADFALSAARGCLHSTKHDDLVSVDALARHYRTCAAHDKAMDTIGGLVASYEETAKDLHIDESALPSWNSVFTIAHRHGVVMLRNRLIRAQVLKHAAAALLFGILYYDLGHTYRDAENRIAVLYISVFFCATTNLQIVPQMIDDRTLYYRERAAGAYTTAMHYAAKAICVTPTLVMQTLLFACIVYWMVGLRDDNDSFAYLLLLLFTLQLAGYFFCSVFAVVAPTQQAAFIILVLPITFLAFFTGFAPRPDEVPVGWSWAPYSNFAFWALKGALVSEFENTGVWVDEITGRPWTDEEILEEFNSDDWNRMSSVYTTLWFGCGFLLASYFGLRYIDWTKM